MDKAIKLYTHRHLGDECIMFAVCANIHAQFPDTQIYVRSWEWDGILPSYIHLEPPKRKVTEAYCSFGNGERVDNGLNMVSGCLKQVSMLLGENIKFTTESAPLIPIDADVAKMEKYRGYILLNSSCEDRSRTKFYFGWDFVANSLVKNGRKVAIIGGGHRMIPTQHSIADGIVDLRGKTTRQELVALASVCGGLISPPSGIVHICAAFSKPTVCVIGAREPKNLCSYKNVTIMSSHCTKEAKWNPAGGTGCCHLWDCSGMVKISDKQWIPECMARIAPQSIVDKALEVIK